MKVSRIKIQNILGIERLEIEPGKVTRVSGANGVGKSSVIEAVRSAFAKGSDATLLRAGQSAGEVVLVLEDDGQEFTVRRRITEKTDSTTVDGKAGKSFLQEIASAARLNPAALINAKPAARLEMMLQACNFEFPTEELAAIIRPLAAQLSEGAALREEIIAATRSHDPLDALDAVSSRVFGHRTGINRSAKDAEALAATLDESLPEKEPTVIEAELTKRRDELRAAETERDNEVDASFTEQQSAMDAAAATHSAAESEANRIYNDALRAAAAAKDVACAAARSKHNEAVEQINARLQPEIKAAEADVATLQEQLNTANRAAKAVELRTATRAKTAGLKVESEACSQALEAISGLKQKLVAQIPVEGIEIRDGDIFVDGIAFDRVNMQRRIDIAVTIAERMPAKLDLCIIDGFEALDEQHQAAFLKRMAEGPLQAIVAEVTAGPLTVASEAA